MKTKSNQMNPKVCIETISRIICERVSAMTWLQCPPYDAERVAAADTQQGVFTP